MHEKNFSKPMSALESPFNQMPRLLLQLASRSSSQSASKDSQNGNAQAALSALSAGITSLMTQLTNNIATAEATQADCQSQSASMNSELSDLTVTKNAQGQIATAATTAVTNLETSVASYDQENLQLKAQIQKAQQDMRKAKTASSLQRRQLGAEVRYWTQAVNLFSTAMSDDKIKSSSNFGAMQTVQNLLVNGKEEAQKTKEAAELEWAKYTQRVNTTLKSFSSSLAALTASRTEATDDLSEKKAEKTAASSMVANLAREIASRAAGGPKHTGLMNRCDKYLVPCTDANTSADQPEMCQVLNIVPVNMTVKGSDGSSSSINVPAIQAGAQSNDTEGAIFIQNMKTQNTQLKSLLPMLEKMLASVGA